MKHLPLLLISLLLIISCEKEEETFDLVGTWNISSITELDNKDCTVDTSSTATDSTDEGDMSDIGEWSGTITFTDSTATATDSTTITFATADYIFSIPPAILTFQGWCEMMGGTMEGNSCTLDVGGEFTGEWFEVSGAAAGGGQMRQNGAHQACFSNARPVANHLQHCHEKPLNAQSGN